MTALAGLAVPQTALAQSIALIGNLGEDSDGSAALDRAHGQKFRTGAEAGGYEIGLVQIPITKSEGAVAWTVDLRGDGTVLNNVIFTFDGPSAISTGTNTYTFTAPTGAEATLRPSKNYWVVARQTGGRGANLQWVSTESNGKAGLEGWTLDSNHARQEGSTYWPIQFGSALKLRVDAVPPIVEDVRVVSTPPAVGFYRTGDEILVDVMFSAPVRFRVPADSGDGQLSLWFDGTTPARFGGARYRSGSGTDTIRYAYTVRSDDLDPDGLTIGAKEDNGIGDFVPVNSALSAFTVDESFGARSDLAGHRVNGPVPQGGGPGSALVSNLGQSDRVGGVQVVLPVRDGIAQRFTTGPNRAGYTLNNVLVGSAAFDRFSAAIYTVDSSGDPDEEVAALRAPPSTFGRRTVTFTAPATQSSCRAPPTRCVCLAAVRSWARPRTARMPARLPAGASGTVLIS